MRLISLAILVSVLSAPLAAGAAEACADRADGTVEGRLDKVALDDWERAMVSERFASDFVEAGRLGLAEDALFGFARCELNAASPTELVVIGRSPSHCIGVDRAERPICGVWILADTPKGWIQVLEAAGTPRLAAGATGGWRDLVLETGRLPVAMKFGGAVYQEDLGDADPLPEALDGWDAPGPGGVDWYDFDDVMPVAAEDAFLRFYARELRGTGARVGALPDAFRVGVAELTGEPPEEVILMGVSPQFCGPEGCRHWILSVEGEDAPWVLGIVEGFDLRVATTGGDGGLDLVLEAGGRLAVWRNDGAGWRRSDGP